MTWAWDRWGLACVVAGLGIGLANGLAGPVAIGVDLGTSGIRLTALQPSADGVPQVVHSDQLPWTDEAGAKAETWLQGLRELLRRCPGDVAASTGAVAISGTSATSTVVDVDQRRITRAPRMYDYAVSGPTADEAMRRIVTKAPEGHTVRARTSAFAKLVAWHLEAELRPSERLAHQADLVATALCSGTWFTDETCETEGTGAPLRFASDWHNALKLGYDVGELAWPAWLLDTLAEVGLDPMVLPSEILRPGSARLADGSDRVVTAAGSAASGLPEGCKVVGGTTDSIAAFVASGCTDPGQAVTSLGSTMAIKMISQTKVDDASFGVYSHRLGDAWLVGGASNVGCRIFRDLDYSDTELAELSRDISMEHLSFSADLEKDPTYYPLVDAGERFPINDPHLQPRLPSPEMGREKTLEHLLVSIAEIERLAFLRMTQLGATPVKEVQTCGGGSKNPTWLKIREECLGVPVSQAAEADAAYGAALLALRGL